MKNCIRPSLLIISLFLLLLPGCEKKEIPKKVRLYERAGNPSGQPERPQPNTLWFGFDLKLGPKEELSIYTPFLQYLERATGKRFRIKFTREYEDTVKNLGTGVTDFAVIGPLSFVTGQKKYGIRYLVSGVNSDGDPRYHSVIFTRSDSPVRNVSDLRGKCFAFGSEMSTQGHLIPRKMLEDAGITLNDLSEYIYTGSHVNAVKSVLNGECDAGGIQDTLARRLASEGKIKIIKISDSYPSSFVAYNSHVDAKIVESVRSALLALEPKGRHKDILVDWDKTEMPLGFSKVDQPEFNKVMALASRYGLEKQ
jgi:phosphonate transport system substrate-binding protein